MLILMLCWLTGCVIGSHDGFYKGKREKVKSRALRSYTDDQLADSVAVIRGSCYDQFSDELIKTGKVFIGNRYAMIDSLGIFEIRVRPDTIHLLFKIPEYQYFEWKDIVLKSRQVQVLEVLMLPEFPEN